MLSARWFCFALLTKINETATTKQYTLKLIAKIIMTNYTDNIDNKYLHSEITAKILQGFYLVINQVGYGFGIELFKKVLVVELEFLGLNCELDKLSELVYKNKNIGNFKIDISVNNKVNVMIISENIILRKHEVKFSNQLKNSDIEVGLLLNAYIEGSHKRIYYADNAKQNK